MFSRVDLLETVAATGGTLRCHASENAKFYNDAWQAFDAWLYDVFTEGKVGCDGLVGLACLMLPADSAVPADRSNATIRYTRLGNNGHGYHWWRGAQTVFRA
jgi:hypothetical protein